MLLCIVLSLTEADIAPLQYHGKEQHVGTKSGVSLASVWLTPAQLQFPTAVCSGIPRESSVMAWTVRRLYRVSRDIVINRFTKGNAADHVQPPTYHIFQDVSMATTVLDAWLLLVHITLQQL